MESFKVVRKQKDVAQEGGGSTQRKKTSRRLGGLDHVGPMSPFSGLWLSRKVLSREESALTDFHVNTFALTSGKTVG